MNNLIYLDNAANAPLCPEALAAWQETAAITGNPSSFHGQGRRLRQILEESRGAVAHALGFAPECVVFTSGGTESVNLALRGIAAHAGKRRHIVTTALEHPAAAETLKALTAQGFSVTVVPPERGGGVSPERMMAAVTGDTFLVNCVWVCGETGAVNDLAALSCLLSEKAPHVRLHSDGVQGFLRLPNQLHHTHITSISGHKIGAPMGIGALAVRLDVKLRPCQTGGGQQRGLRSGTEAVALAAAFAAAVRAWRGVDPSLRPLSLDGMQGMGGAPFCESGAPHIAAAGFPGFTGEVLVRMLSDRGVMTGSGSACHGVKASPILAAMPWLPKAARDGALRLSFSPQTTREEVSRALETLRQIITGR